MCCVGLFKINFFWFLFVILGLVILFSHVDPTGEKETKLIRKKQHTVNFNSTGSFISW